MNEGKKSTIQLLVTVSPGLGAVLCYLLTQQSDELFWDYLADACDDCAREMEKQMAQMENRPDSSQIVGRLCRATMQLDHLASLIRDFTSEWDE